MSISRVGAAGGVQRDRPSAGHEAVAKADTEANGVQQPAPHNERVEQVAKMYEKQFLGEMFKAMRATVTPTDKPSMAENIYKDQLDDQYVDAWSEKGGVGLSDMIYNQIMERYFGQGASDGLRKQGPVALTNRDVVNVARLKTSSASAGQVPLQVEVKPSANGKGPAQIQAPWEAKVLQSVKMDGGKTAVTLEHDQGVKSTLIFEGVPSAETKVGERLSKGQTIGILSPEAKSFMWNLNPGTKTETSEQ